MKKVSGIIILLAWSQLMFSQNWVDTTYEISSVFDIAYGVSTDFKGADYTAEMDISAPTNDTPPECGRPLMVIVHGGAWYGGDKMEGYSSRLREDFAKRGYVTASVNYRQGLFNTSQVIDCVLEGWKCWNMTDTSEWYRANFRAIQDVHGVVRYLVNEKEIYNINPENIFLVGESAGGFVVLGAGFIDDQSEILEELINDLPDAPPPHPIYEDDCIREFDLANGIAEMDLNRPSLGSIEGDLNFPVQSNYRIRGVGSFYGGVFNNIFETYSEDSPALYLFHQPCDLIVPFHYNKLLAGYSTCATQFPTFCQHIVNRPFVYGSSAIATLIDELAANNVPTCEYLFDNSENTYSCLEQVVNADLACHAMDNYWQRTVNMGTFFAGEMVDCTMTGSLNFIQNGSEVVVYPNPTRNRLILRLPATHENAHIQIVDAFGKTVLKFTMSNTSSSSIDISNINQGIYQIWIGLENKRLTYPLVKI